MRRKKGGSPDSGGVLKPLRWDRTLEGSEKAPEESASKTNRSGPTKHWGPRARMRGWESERVSGVPTFFLFSYQAQMILLPGKAEDAAKKMHFRPLEKETGGCRFAILRKQTVLESGNRIPSPVSFSTNVEGQASCPPPGDLRWGHVDIS